MKKTKTKTPAPPPKPTKSLFDAVPPKDSAPAKPAPPITAKLGTDIVRIAVDLIDPSPFNPRQADIDSPKVIELANSILIQGIVNPLIVRPSPTKKGRFELIAGERRYLGAMRAELADVPCRSGDLSDTDAHEIQTIENLQRENLNEIEEAVGFQQMLELKDGAQPRYTLKSLGERVGKSEQFVYGRLKLLKACPRAQENFLKGKLSASTLLLLARIPNAKEADEATKTILDRELSYRNAKDLIEREYMKRLKDSPFDQEDATLTKAGPCSTCPFRTGNLKKLSPDITSTDVCTHTACYSAKCHAHAERAVASAKKEGLKVLPAKGNALWQKYHGEERTHLVSYGEGANYVDLDAPCGDLPGNKPLRVALKDHLPPLIATLDTEANLRTIATKEDVAKAVKAAGIKLINFDSKRGSSDTGSKQQAAFNRKQKLFKTMQRHVGREMVKAAEAAKPDLAFWQLITEVALQLAGHDIRHEIVNRRELNMDEGKRISGCDDTDLLSTLTKAFKTEGHWRGLLVEALIMRNPRFYDSSTKLEDTFGDDINDGCKLFGLDLKKLIAHVQKQDDDRAASLTAKKADKQKK